MPVAASFSGHGATAPKRSEGGHAVQKIFLCCLILSATPAAYPQEEKTSDEPATNISAAGSVRAYLEVQEKLHATLLAIDRYQKEADAAAARAAETSASRVAESFTTRLTAIEQSLNTQRAQQEQSRDKSDRFMLTLTGVFGALGLLALLGAAWLHLRAANRLAEVVAASRVSGLGFGRVPSSLEAGDLPATVSPDSNLPGTISRLEKRIRELEMAAHILPPTGSAEVKTNGHAPEPGAAVEPGSATEMRTRLLLGKGQSLLHLNKIQEAIACFDEALEIEPTNPEALIKKGTALERQEKLKEAIEYYDRAIEVDGSLTIAYLQKGGVFNRLELYSMAQECYEQALRTHERQSA